MPPGPVPSAGPKDSGAVAVAVEVAAERIGLGRIGDLEEEVWAVLGGAGPGRPDFALAVEDAKVGLAAALAAERHELHLCLERGGFRERLPDRRGRPG